MRPSLVMSYRKGKILKVSVVKIWLIISTSVLRFTQQNMSAFADYKMTDWIAITNSILIMMILSRLG
ncbi:hypothetical protein ACNKHT_02010 [Shigella flexneri]